MDSPAQLFTMSQFDENYITGYRLLAKGLNSSIKNKRISENLQKLLMIVFVPLTHEEGHRAVLTVHNIGSVSQPFFNKHGAAYVKGVRDAELLNMRDTNLPDYIRLHTAGLESDYMLTKKAEDVVIFGLDDYKNLRQEYFIRKLSIIAYIVPALFKYDVKLKEEEDELERDIVGHDVYGAIRHLHRPDMEFYRYTRYRDLTTEEVDFTKRAAFRSMLNFLNPLLIGKENFRIGEKLLFNAGAGYTMSPFGDFIDESLWLKYNKLNLNFYARQFQNRTSWFPGFGLGVTDYDFNEHLTASLSGHFWRQPDNFDFNTNDSFTGGAIDAEIKYFFTKLTKPESKLKAISVDVGIEYKTKGFFPEDLYLNEHLSFRIGSTIRLSDL